MTYPSTDDNLPGGGGQATVSIPLPNGGEPAIVNMHQGQSLYEFIRDVGAHLEREFGITRAPGTGASGSLILAWEEGEPGRTGGLGLT